MHVKSIDCIRLTIVFSTADYPEREGGSPRAKRGVQDSINIKPGGGHNREDVAASLRLRRARASGDMRPQGLLQQGQFGG